MLLLTLCNDRIAAIETLNSQKFCWESFFCICVCVCLRLKSSAYILCRLAKKLHKRSGISANHLTNLVHGIRTMAKGKYNIEPIFCYSQWNVSCTDIQSYFMVFEKESTLIENAKDLLDCILLSLALAHSHFGIFQIHSILLSCCMFHAM